jgi:hypothetical protein
LLSISVPNYGLFQIINCIMLFMIGFSINSFIINNFLLIAILHRGYSIKWNRLILIHVKVIIKIKLRGFLNIVNLYLTIKGRILSRIQSL